MPTARRLALFVAVPSVLVACASDLEDGGDQNVPDVESGTLDPSASQAAASTRTPSDVEVAADNAATGAYRQSHSSGSSR